MMECHDAYPRAIHGTPGLGVTRCCSRYKNNRIEQNHRSIKQRYYPMRGFGRFASAVRFCTSFEEQRQYVRAARQIGAGVSLADQRYLLQQRRTAAFIEMAAA